MHAMAVEQAEASEKYTVEHTATSWQQQLQYDHSAEVERAGERERERGVQRANDVARTMPPF